ncbi:Yae1 family protein [Blastococcus montanus]|uniref:Yae1 family protein n=1 Tax=Blastococcus montanus TaxID=3144973 RepID=UPI00320AA784
MTRMDYPKRNREARARRYPPTIQGPRPDPTDAYLIGHRDGYEAGQREGFTRGRVQGLEEGIQIGTSAGFDGALTFVTEVAATVRLDGGKELKEAISQMAVKTAKQKYLAEHDVADPQPR